MAKVLVAEKIAERGIDILKESGHEVVVKTDLTPETILDAVSDVEALIVRSASQVTKDVIQAGKNLQVVGRAGVGIDNVDVQAATEAGITVVNAPDANVRSAAEQALTLILASARNVAQASAALKGGSWERSKWGGIELDGKTVGVVGLGKVATFLTRWLQAMNVTVVAYDPYLSDERAEQMGVEKIEDLKELFSRCDFVSLHIPKTPETKGIISKEVLDSAKPGLRLINTARGGLIDDEALALAIQEGRLGGAAIDVWDPEPITESPLFELDQVVATPHLGASTTEAQERAGETIAEQVVAALNGEFAEFAVNLPIGRADKALIPYIQVAEMLGRLLCGLEGGVPKNPEVFYQGGLASHDTQILKLSFLKGLLAGTGERASYVNASTLADDMDITVAEMSQRGAGRYVNRIKVQSGQHSAAATTIEIEQTPVIVMVDGIDCYVPPAENMVVVRNDDRKGMLAGITTAISDAGINIADLQLARDEKGGTALAVVALDEKPSDQVADTVRAIDGVLDVRTIGLV